MTHNPQQIQAKDININMAMERLQIAFQEEDDYAHAWHCNLAQAFFDAFGQIDRDKHTVSNNGASIFMRRVFNVNTYNNMLNDKAEK